jgi:hypothetical protein
MTQHYGGNQKVRSASSCVVYDSESGRIHHIHHNVTLEGGHEPNQQEIEAHALAQLSDRGIKGGHLAAIHVEPDSIKPGSIYAVDPKTRKLVAKGERRQLARS